MDALNLAASIINNPKACLTDTNKYQKQSRKLHKKKDKKRFTNSVGQVIKNIDNKSEANWLLGLRNDGIPVYLEYLQSPFFPMLICCGEGCGKTHHLQVLADSYIQLTKYRQLKLFVLTNNPSEWFDLISRLSKNNVSINAYSWQDPVASELVDTISIKAEKLMENKRDKSNKSNKDDKDNKDNKDDIILIMDDLSGLLHLKNDSQINLLWLLEYGKSVGIWSAASLNTEELSAFEFWVKVFPFSITGSCSRSSISNDPLTDSCMVPSILQPGEFSVRIGNRWIIYHLPMLGN